MEPQGITGCRLFLREVEDSGDGYLHMNLRPFIQGANNALLSLPLAAFSSLTEFQDSRVRTQSVS